MPEVLRIIIAVLCLILLIMLAVQLYSIFTRSNELEQAKATLNEIIAKAAVLQKEGDKTDLLIINPKNWVIISFPEAKELCMCTLKDSKVQADCEKKGTCQKTTTPFNIAWTCGDIKNCYSLEKLPLEIIMQFENKAYQFRTRGDVNAAEMFSGVLEYTGSETKSVKNYIEDLLNTPYLTAVYGATPEKRAALTLPSFPTVSEDLLKKKINAFLISKNVKLAPYNAYNLDISGPANNYVYQVKYRSDILTKISSDEDSGVHYDFSAIGKLPSFTLKNLKGQEFTIQLSFGEMK